MEGPLSQQNTFKGKFQSVSTRSLVFLMSQSAVRRKVLCFVQLVLDGSSPFGIGMMNQILAFFHLLTAFSGLKQ